MMCAVKRGEGIARAKGLTPEPEGTLMLLVLFA